jgi:hypothetical protein
MGYLSERKKQTRIIFTIQFLLVSLGLLSILGFFDNHLGNICNQWRFQMYIISILLFSYSAINCLILYSFLSFIIIILNFFVISSETDIFLQDKFEGKSLKIVYQKQPQSLTDIFKDASDTDSDIIAVINPKTSDFEGLSLDDYNILETNGSFVASKEHPETAGKIKITAQNAAPFVILRGGNSNIIILGVDFSTINNNDLPYAFNQIEDFLLSRDEPVIILGDFKIVAWSAVFATFLDHTGLYVKNSLSSSVANYIFPPQFYVLGYRNMHFNKQEYLSPKDNKYQPIFIDIDV